MIKAPITCLLCTLGTTVLASGQSLRLDINEAVAMALDRNFSIRIEQLEPDAARETVRGERGAFDPELDIAYRYERQEYGQNIPDDESALGSIEVGSLLPLGTSWQAGLEVNDQTSPFGIGISERTDAVVSFAGITVTQPLLRNFGSAANLAGLRSAEEAFKASWQGFRLQVMNTVASTVAAYHGLHAASENVRIAEQNRDLALQLLEDNRRRVETGAMAPVDLIQAESEAALREDAVIRAQNQFNRARNALKALIWADPATVLDLELTIDPPDEPDRFTPNISRDVRFALEERPEYLASLSGLAIRRIEAIQLRNQALPQLDLVGSYGRLGIETSLDSSLDEAFSDGQPAYSVGAVVSIPFPNRARSADRARALIRQNQSELQLTQLEQDIRLQLADAATQLDADWNRIQATRTARELAEQSLAAENKKLQAGTSSTFIVLRLQGDLALAEIREINALSDYAISLIQYERVRGRILETFNIHLQPSR